jgi:DNA-binding CsgD family transcriptional regulator
VFRAPVFSRAFIGRREELAALYEARRDLASSRGGAILIGGETGIGKSRLLAQFVAGLREARSRRILVTAECLERIQQPFGPIRTFVTALARSARAEELSPNVRRAVAQITRSDVPGPTGAEPAVMERAELLATLVEFVKIVVARTAAVLAIEDIQWADRSTLDFLEYAVPRLSRSRILIVATYRSDELERNEALFNTVSQLLREPNVARLTLAAFSRSELGALIDDALEGRAVLPAGVRHDIEQRSEGNPFFAEELVKSALEARGTSVAASLPLSIRASILQRLATLSPEDRRILERAAVLGYRFDPAVLALVMDSDVEAILPTLRRARDLNIVLEEDDRSSRFRFRHALTRQTIYSGMLVFDARRLHAQILAALESLEDRDRHIDALAYHAWEAKDPAKTLAYNERAGDAALAQRALAEAATCFDRAREVAMEEDDRARLAERAGQVATLQGRLAQGLDALEAAFAIRLRRGELDAAATLQATIIIERNNLGDEGAPARGEAFLERYGAELSAPVRDRLLVNIARLFVAQYDFERAEPLLAAVTEPRSLAPRVRQNYLISRLERHCFLGEVTAWRALLPELLQNADLVASELRMIVFYSLVQVGSYMGANEVVERALIEAQRTDDGFAAVAAFGDAVRAAYLLQRGRLAESRASLERALERPDIAISAIVSSQTAPLLAVATGDPDLVGRCIAPALLENARNAIDYEHAILLGSHAEWLASSGALATAQADLRLALSMFPAALPTLAPILIAAAKYLNLDELPAVSAHAERFGEGDGNDAGRVTLLLVSAIVAARSGQPTAAVTAALAAAELAEGLGWPLVEASAFEIAGRPEKALALYESCGAKADASRLAETTGAGTRTRGTSLLSSRELEVATLVSLGFTNKAISERLFVGQKTVEKHLASIFRKLDVSSRVQVATFVQSQAALAAAGIPETTEDGEVAS